MVRKAKRAPPRPKPAGLFDTRLRKKQPAGVRRSPKTEKPKSGKVGKRSYKLNPRGNPGYR